MAERFPMTRRRSITPQEKIASLRYWGVFICGYCGEAIVFGQPLHFAHGVADALGGSTKPENLRPAHAECHVKATHHKLGKHTTYASENWEIKHANDLAAGPKPRKGRQIQSKGFDRTRTRHFDGTISPRRKSGTIEGT